MSYLFFPRSTFFTYFLVAFLVMFGAFAESDEGDCSPINGEYLSAGESDSEFSEYFDNPRLERNIFGVELPNIPVYSVQIKLDDLLQYMQLEFMDINGKRIFGKKWSQAVKCTAGSLVFESDIKGGSDGSSVLSTNTLMVMSKMEDDKLAVQSWTKTKYRSWFFFEKETVFEVSYKFFAVLQDAYHLKSNDTVRDEK